MLYILRKSLLALLDRWSVLPEVSLRDLGRPLLPVVVLADLVWELVVFRPHGATVRIS